MIHCYNHTVSCGVSHSNTSGCSIHILDHGTNGGGRMKGAVKSCVLAHRLFEMLTGVKDSSCIHILTTGAFSIFC